MEKTWRWFGKKDKITLSMLRQIGVEGIVTALHDIPNGEIWPYEAVAEMRDYVAAAGLRWSVVESLPVSESIKYGGPDRDRLIEIYIVSLAYLGKAGIKTVCYNFMPVLDWARTDLEHPNADGTSSLYGKTGTGTVDGKNTNGWFIGFVESVHGPYSFAVHISGEDGATGAKAGEIALDILKAKKLFGGN